MKPFSVMLLLLCCGVAQARDPFRPLTGVACVAEVEPLSEWRLQGIIGRAPRFQGWLLTPQGNAVKVLSDQPFPLLPWQTDQFTSRTLRLSVPGSCSSQYFTFHLKGSPHDKDIDSDVSADLPDVRPRQP
ncbi:HofP DNA utilization family protein [Pantoea allii]|uniref:HofP DNA utilization family protein n=1 Tax=Pantoea allii TaxID=574096 RepID=UPI0024B6ECBB|nr:HofP DNA utilization family protein [Pantoea allii]MDJ0037814.1 HofP DNA utilization family protein [Pantoea allii]